MTAPIPHRLGPWTVPWALLASAATGAVLTGVVFGLGAGLFPGASLLDLTVVPAAFLFSFPVWLIGVFVLGGPSWWRLQDMGVRSRGAGAATGALLTFIIAGAYAFLVAKASPRTWPWALGFASGMTTAGAGAGWVLVHVAYPKGVR